MIKDIITPEGILIVVYIVLYVWNTILWMKEYRDEYPPQDPSQNKKS
jgi:hypothetical protein